MKEKCKQYKWLNHKEMEITKIKLVKLDVKDYRRSTYMISLEYGKNLDMLIFKIEKSQTDN